MRCRTFFEFPVPCYSLEEKNRLPDTLFANPFRPKKKRLDHDSENSALDLIQRILLEFGYFGLIIGFLDFAEKTQNSFLIEESLFGFPKKRTLN